MRNWRRSRVYSRVCAAISSPIYIVVDPACIAYQIEIDNLTKRSKSAENAFLNVYKVLAEAPDPYPLLEAAVVSTTQPTICVDTGSRDSVPPF